MPALCAPVVFAPRALSRAASVRGKRLTCNVKARLHKNARIASCSLPPRAQSSAAAAVPALEELLARLRRGEAPLDTLAFTLPMSETAAGNACITARLAVDDDDAATTRDVPADVLRAIQAHVLPVRSSVYLARVSDEESRPLPLAAPATVYQPGEPCVIIYIYPLEQTKWPEWVYETPPDGSVGLSVHDIVRCVAATYQVMYVAEACDRSRGSAADGRFGIWGHGVGELVLEGFSWVPTRVGGGGALLPTIVS
jgi:hypothetical protein